MKRPSTGRARITARPVGRYNALSQTTERTRMLSYTADPGLASIKLIACDMDLTLLADDKSQPPHMPERIAALAEAGVVFCPASGRPGPTLEAMFPSTRTTWPSAPDNGGSIIYRGELIYKSLIDPRALSRGALCRTGRGVGRARALRL